MASLLHTIFALTIIIAVLPWSATSNNILAPVLSPILDRVCQEVACGKGTCKASGSSSLGYECVCDAGWRQTRSQNDTSFKFLPCVIPNCSMNYSCQEDAPAPEPNTRVNMSILEPCHWAECGGGSCNKTSELTFTCECKEGYFNLLNSSTFPCFKECALGVGCKNLGFGMNRSNSPPAPSLSDNTNKASSIIGGGFWRVIAAASLAIFLFKSM